MEYVSFKRLSLNDGQDVFDFNENRTIIVGENGTGKSTLVNCLSSPDESVVIDGDRSMVGVYSNLIFISYEYSLGMGCELIADYVGDMVNIKSDVTAIVNEMLAGKNYDINKYDDIKSHQFSLGERVLVYLSHIFAIRTCLTNIELPLVIDDIMGIFDRDLQTRLIQYLNGYECQQILFVTPSEYNGSLGDVE